MTLNDLLQRLDGVKGGDGQYSARCPCHDDRHNSLSVAVGKDGAILLKCHAGCTPEAITGALGLQMSDLFPEKQRSGHDVVATYAYKDDAGNLIAQKLRRADKSFFWRRPDGRGGWVYNRKGVPARLYMAGEWGNIVFVCEGEKDVDNLHALGFAAASGQDGAGKGKWKPEYSEQLRGKVVRIFFDNDDVGKDYGIETANALHGVAESVQLCDLAKIWPEIPEHGDVSDLIAHFGAEQAREMIFNLVSDTPIWTPSEDPLFASFKTLDEFSEEDAAWLVPGWIPEGQITIVAADGGVGKTTLWCNIVAALSNGEPCILDPPGYARTPMKVTFMTTEDSVRKKLRRKLRLAGANMQNIRTPDFVGNDILHKLKFGSLEMERALRHFRPVLCVFDPVQGFIPPKVNMGSRNEMRDCVSPLITIGEEVGTTSLIMCHTNKRKGASGRDRIADSADLWDIARSVIMLGYTEEQGVRYLSNEKNNYTQLQETILFTIDSDGQPIRVGTSWKRDREYMQDADISRSKPKREDCKEFILKMLDESGGALSVKELDAKTNAAGYSARTARRAKDELKQSGTIQYRQTGALKNKAWSIQRVEDFKEISEYDPDFPWNDQTPSDI